jgi:hypothetical protein
LQLYCLYHKIMLHEVKKYKFSKLKCKIMWFYFGFCYNFVSSTN